MNTKKTYTIFVKKHAHIWRVNERTHECLLYMFYLKVNWVIRKFFFPCFIQFDATKKNWLFEQSDTQLPKTGKKWILTRGKTIKYWSSCRVNFLWHASSNWHMRNGLIAQNYHWKSFFLSVFLSRLHLVPWAKLEHLINVNRARAEGAHIGTYRHERQYPSNGLRPHTVVRMRKSTCQKTSIYFKCSLPYTVLLCCVPFNHSPTQSTHTSTEKMDCLSFRLFLMSFQLNIQTYTHNESFYI